MNENGRGFGSLNVPFLGVNVTKLDVINLPFSGCANTAGKRALFDMIMDKME